MNFKVCGESFIVHRSAHTRTSIDEWGTVPFNERVRLHDRPNDYDRTNKMILWKFYWNCFWMLSTSIDYRPFVLGANEKQKMAIAFSTFPSFWTEKSYSVHQLPGLMGAFKLFMVNKFRYLWFIWAIWTERKYVRKTWRKHKANDSKLNDRSCLINLLICHSWLSHQKCSIHRRLIVHNDRPKSIFFMCVLAVFLI